MLLRAQFFADFSWVGLCWPYHSFVTVDAFNTNMFFLPSSYSTKVGIIHRNHPNVVAMPLAGVFTIGVTDRKHPNVIAMPRFFYDINFTTFAMCLGHDFFFLLLLPLFSSAQTHNIM